jgi:hypothetical protein
LGGKDPASISIDHFNVLKLTGRNKLEIGSGITVKMLLFFFVKISSFFLMESAL